jgi:hypothetical protein
MQLDNLVERSWHREMLPDFLWIALMLGRRSAWGQFRAPMDVIDRFVPEGPRFADGRLTGFALVPTDRRSAAVEALRNETPFALPEAFGHVVGLLDSCPARWLYESWLRSHEPDPAIAIPLLRSLVDDNADKAGVRSTRLRMAAFSRRVVHGKFSHPGTGVWGLFPRYPDNLSEEDQRAVESVLRAGWGGLYGMEIEEFPELLNWPGDFWSRCRELVPCQCSVTEEPLPVAEDSEGPVDPESLLQLSEMRALLDAFDDLGESLRSAQASAFSDPKADEPNAVLLGLASRMFRLAYDFLERPSAWAPSTATLHLRPLVDARILSAWLLKRNDPTTYAAYREHGLGRLKLLREHVKADFGDDTDEEAKAFLAYLDARVNLERDEWFQPVNLGSFAEVSPREMAIETDLKRLYDLSYAPASAANHGDWSHVRDYDTLLCEEPLHGGHRVGRFRPSSRQLGFHPAFFAVDVARAGVTAVFAHYGVDVEAAFDGVHQALDRAASTGPERGAGDQ